MRIFNSKIKLLKKLFIPLVVGVVLFSSGWQIYAQVQNNAPNYQYQAFITGSGLPSSRILQRGRTYSLYAELKNVGSGEADEARLLIKNNNPEFTAGPYVASDTQPVGTPRRGYGTQNCDGDECFSWQFTPGIKRHESRQATFTFNVSGAAKDGSQLCFEAIATPHTPTNIQFRGNKVCLAVKGEATDGPVAQTDANIRRPYLTTSGGNIHAGALWGDGACLQPEDDLLNPARVRGRVSTTGSKAEYVVSAGQNVSNFGSANDKDSISLTFGSYGLVCRPDLAKRYLEDPGVNQFPPGAPSSFGMTYLNSSNFDGMAKISGNIVFEGGQIPIGRKITLVVDGDVLISGNVTPQGGNYSSVSRIPSFGIIATGNINIQSSVTDLYGIYYAGSSLSGFNKGIINTCQNANSAVFNPLIGTAGGASACNGALNVEGAFIATNIYWRRTLGDADQNTAAAETINYTPLLILNPPIGLGGVVGQF